MSESDFEHEYLFVLGNGASIASANPELSKYNPSMGNIIPILEKMDELRDIVKLRVRGEIFSGDMLHPIYKFNAG
jgi:hypothetical protein